MLCWPSIYFADLHFQHALQTCATLRSSNHSIKKYPLQTFRLLWCGCCPTSGLAYGEYRVAMLCEAQRKTLVIFYFWISMLSKEGIAVEGEKSFFCYVELWEELRGKWRSIVWAGAFVPQIVAVEDSKIAQIGVFWKNAAFVQSLLFNTNFEV